MEEEYNIMKGCIGGYHNIGPVPASWVTCEALVGMPRARMGHGIMVFVAWIKVNPLKILRGEKERKEKWWANCKTEKLEKVGSGMKVVKSEEWRPSWKVKVMLQAWHIYFESSESKAKPTKPLLVCIPNYLTCVHRVTHHVNEPQKTSSPVAEKPHLGIYRFSKPDLGVTQKSNPTHLYSLCNKNELFVGIGC